MNLTEKISRQDFRVLCHIIRNGDVTAKDLMERGIPRTTAYTSIYKLLELRLIDKSKHYKSSYTATKSGRKTAVDIYKEIQSTFNFGI